LGDLLWGESVKPQQLKVGLEITPDGENAWIITDVIGGGKFKAVMKANLKTNAEIRKTISARYIESILKKPIIVDGKKLYYTSSGETIDISIKNKKSAGQQGIRLTPEIKAKIRGEAPTLKQPSGISPFGKAQIGTMTGITAGTTGVLATLAALKKKNKQQEGKNYAEKIASIKMPTSRELEPGETEYNVATKKMKYKPEVGELKSATLTVYHPEKEQTDESPDIGGFSTKMEFGDVGVGNRDEYKKARSKFFKDKIDTFIYIPELKNIETPYGNGIFRVRDTMKITNDGKNMLDIFMPNAGSDTEKIVRNTPKATYTYLKI